jgi:hypothetical protein
MGKRNLRASPNSSAARGEALEGTFEDWKLGALTAICELQSAARRVRNVLPDIEALVTWCRERG